MLTEYINESIKLAKYEVLEDGTIFGEIPNFKGVFANSISFEKCRSELIEILEEWIFIRLRMNLEIPIVSNYNLNSLEIADATY